MVPATFDAILPSVLSSCNDSETTLFQLAHASHHTRQLILRLTCVPKANPSKHSSATSTISVSSFLRDPELVHLLISPHPIAEPFPPLRQIGESNAYPLAGGRNIHAPSGEPAILATDPTLINLLLQHGFDFRDLRSSFLIYLIAPHTTNTHPSPSPIRARTSPTAILTSSYSNPFRPTPLRQSTRPRSSAP
jgi:hypothetical protein